MCPSTLHLTLCVIARDEEAVLGRCLDSVRGLVGQMIVADTGSQDGTMAVARKHGAEVFSFPWTGDFAAARNACLERARGRYILALDADEFLLEVGRSRLRALLQRWVLHTPEPTPQMAAQWPGFSVLLQDMDAEGRPGLLARVVRLFPNLPWVRYEWPVHEQVETALRRAGHPVEPTDLLLGHTGYAAPERRRQKQQRNLAILREQMAQAHRRGESVHPVTLFHAGGACLDLGLPREALSYYEQCAALVEPESELGRGVVVRLASAWRALGCWEEVARQTCSGPTADWHPELLVDRGLAVAQMGERWPGETAWWFHLALRSPVRPLFPACNFGVMRAEALLGLGSYWHGPGGLPALGVAILRAALAERQGGPVVSQNALAALYRAHGACLPQNSMA